MGGSKVSVYSCLASPAWAQARSFLRTPAFSATRVSGTDSCPLDTLKIVLVYDRPIWFVACHFALWPGCSLNRWGRRVWLLLGVESALTYRGITSIFIHIDDVCSVLPWFQMVTTVQTPLFRHWGPGDWGIAHHCRDRHICQGMSMNTYGTQ